MKTRIAILGGGPSALFVLKRFVEAGQKDLEIHIFESKKLLGAGMPYSYQGSNQEHVTNVSDNEIPEIVTSIEEWIQTVPEDVLTRFGVDRDGFNEYKVLPRLLFGQYLSAQFDLLLKKAERLGLQTHVHTGCRVIDITDVPGEKKVDITIETSGVSRFNRVVICTGHNWPVKHEGTIPGYFDSPYPPAKLKLQLNHPVAIRGSSLTAIDAMRTLARNNGAFHTEEDGTVVFVPSEESPDFKLVMHSRNGLLPAIRFHLEDPLLSDEALLTEDEIEENRQANDGFLQLDYIFEKAFIDLFREKDPEFYERIKDQSIEEFVEMMMGLREKMEPFALFRREYAEAEKSIRSEKSIHWKEILAVLSYVLNYPAKYMSAEDRLRLQKVLMPLISIVIAFVPQSSAKEMLALDDAGKLEIVSVGDDSEVDPESKGGVTYRYTDHSGEAKAVYYNTFVDCIGQPHLPFESFPFKSLIANGTVRPAHLKFRSSQAGGEAVASGNKDVEQTGREDFFLKVPGIAITDNFQVISRSGDINHRIYIMAVPYIGGYNPDYSGLDFCEQASLTIVGSILED
ncbi:FAD/NAD(P)-binding protein [Dyadobacter chenwenxiniae]|uniref:FAD/NAD(P)-binding protein n=1 Tax=Dyadobacter chenwenxiniae TaxID=2906456 RepID=A0A9X1PQ88_9BACT|nr:FAD/NAD(P)-binding protein [Dyadobacter chenwenxiniae]MCF0062856.1 FAD/NAD(P)-binding protein [Dyadobacter chenwenxiniae]UON84969.1 FAD/NAD(P)-binding protein [Dyadobacter chenwenxiniae]